jgi:DNA-directed RNA polymerase subunit omega
MIDELRHEELLNMVGGKFKLTALIQRRWLQLLNGERPLVATEQDGRSLTDMEIIIQEILDGKIEMELAEAVEEDDDLS